MKKIAVLGAGLVGGPMAIDLAKDKDFQVTVADRDKNRLDELAKNKSLKTTQMDLSDKEKLREFISGFDLVLSAVPGFMGYDTLKTIIEAGKNVVDIAFFPEDPFLLDDLAKSKGVSAIVDCGVAPGLSNMLTGMVHYQMQQTHTVTIYVGGLPEVRQWPYEYKAVFSPIDVLEEYTRPARIVENGNVVIKTALSEPELIDFTGMGTLEAFNSDGLRSLAKTIKATDMKEKTLRYPGHRAIMEVLRETGFFDKEEIDVNGVKIKPIDLTSRLLFPKWKLNPGEVDITVMRVEIEGVEAGQKKVYTFDLLDRYDPETEIHSMARTTGYTATMGIRLLAADKCEFKGIVPPEYIGKNRDNVQFILDGLKERGVVVNENVEILETM